MTASNGKEALERLAEIQCPCLITLDMFMPVMDGAQFLTEVHERHSQHDDKIFSIPVALLSAAPLEHDKMAATRPLVQEFIKKPIDLNGFLNTVKQYCA